MKLLTDRLSENFIKTHNLDFEQEYTVREIPAIELLVPERFDLAAKLAYIDAKVTGVDLDYARELYSHHIEAFSEGSFSEPGDAKKTSLADFYSAFDALIADFQKNGFNSEKSWIPVGQNQIILDGAHRTACAIYFNLPVTVIEFPEYAVCFDAQYFRSRRLSEELMREMTIFFSRYAQKNLYCACLWPVSQKTGQNTARNYLSTHTRIVCDCDVNLNYSGLRNFMLQIYGHQNWVGTLDNHFSGLSGKVDSCYYPNQSTGVVVFFADSLDETLRIKDAIRSKLKLDKHALHISDLTEEARLMVALLLNANSVHALNFGVPDNDAQFFSQVQHLGSSALLSSDATLAYYGLPHNTLSTTNSLIINPRKYFTFMGCSLPSLDVTRAQHPEIDEQIEEIISKTDYSGQSAKRLAEYKRIERQWIKEHRILRAKQSAARITEKIGLYSLLHRLHHWLRG